MDAQSNMFRHGAFLAGVVLLLIGWKFGIESIID